MSWPFHHTALANYWLRVFILYAIVEACIQLLFNYILNTFGDTISNLEFHGLMWFFQCLLILPIWGIAWWARKKSILHQVFINASFFFLYTYFWFGPVQDTIQFIHQEIQQYTRSQEKRLRTPIDRSSDLSYINYQFLKHSFRLSWFFLANYFYNFFQEEKKRMELTLANKNLELKLLKWHLNPTFYFRTIDHLRQIAAKKPIGCMDRILQLARVMEYIIYEVREQHIEVNKEIQFLRNYIQLVSDQPGSHADFTLQTEGDYSKLKIAPLLLAELIDKIAGTGNGIEGNKYILDIRFSGKEMQLNLQGDFQKTPVQFFSPSDPLYKRLNELYGEKFSYKKVPASGQLNMVLQLDEER